MNSIESTPEQKRLAQRLYEKRQAEDRKRAAEERERIARQAEWDQRKAEREAGQPTKQRLEKGDIEKEVVKYLGVRHRPKPTSYEQYRERMTDDMQFVFNQLVEDAATADVKNVTLNYDRSGSRSAGDRMGGLGAAHLKKIEAFHRYNYMMERLTPRLRSVVKWLVIGEALSDGTRPTSEDVGRYIIGWWRDKTSCRVAGLTAMSIAGEILVEAFHAYNMDQRFRQARVREMRAVNP